MASKNSYGERYVTKCREIVAVTPHLKIFARFSMIVRDTSGTSDKDTFGVRLIGVD